MHPVISARQKREEPALGHHDPLRVYAPLLWVMQWIIAGTLRLGVRAGVFTIKAPHPQMSQELSAAQRITLFRNRHVRRAKISCLRRRRRHWEKGTSQHPSAYMPRAYFFCPFIARMDQSITPAQFNEHYLRANNISRAELYNMDGAHRITGFAPSCLSIIGSYNRSMLSALAGLSKLNFAAPIDPAPP